MIEQSIKPGKTIYKKEKVVLTCIKTEDYIKDNFLNKSLTESIDKSNQLKYNVRYINAGNNKEINKDNVPKKEKEDWIVTEIKDFSKDQKEVTVRIVYTGLVKVPYVIDKTAEEAIEVLKDKNISNIEYTSEDGSAISNLSNWIVVEQSIEKDNSIQANEGLTIKCKKSEDFFNDLLKGLTIPQSNKTLEKYSYNVEYYDSLNDQKVDTDRLSNKVLDDYKVKNVEAYDNDLMVYLVFSGRVEMPQLQDQEVTAALQKLQELKCSNIKVKKLDENNNKDAEWIVINQNISSGTTINADDQIVLECKSKQDYLNSEYKNLSIDAAIKKAEDMHYTPYIKDYLTQEDIDIHSISEKDMQTWEVYCVEINSENELTLFMVFSGEVKMPSVEEERLNNAVNILNDSQISNVKFIGIDGSKVENVDEWIVIEQSINASESIKANNEITLKCQKREDYFKKKFKGKGIEESVKTASELGYSPVFKNYQNGENLKLEATDQNNWIVKKVEDSDNKDEIVLMMVFSGEIQMPNLEGRLLDDSIKLLEERQCSEIKYKSKNEKEIKDLKNWVVTSQSVEAEETIKANKEIRLECIGYKEYLEESIPLETAERIAVVCMINERSIDTIVEDHYDTSKFHRYGEDCEGKLDIIEEGNWTAMDAYTWQVKGLLLQGKNGQYVKILNMDIYFNGTDYICDNIHMITAANRKNLDSMDPSKIDEKIYNGEISEADRFQIVNPVLVE